MTLECSVRLLFGRFNSHFVVHMGRLGAGNTLVEEGLNESRLGVNHPVLQNYEHSEQGPGDDEHRRQQGNQGTRPASCYCGDHLIHLSRPQRAVPKWHSVD